MKKPDDLTPKQQRFVDAYKGNSCEAARLAGYEGAKQTIYRTANRLLKNEKIKKAIRDRQKEENSDVICSRKDREIFLTNILNDSNQKTIDRLRAADILAKMNGDYFTKVELSGSINTTQQVVLYLPDNNRDKE